MTEVEIEFAVVESAPHSIDWSRVGSAPGLLVDVGCRLGEGLCWDERTGELWWVDIDEAALYRHDGARTTRWSMSVRASAVLPARAGGVILATDVGLVRPDLARDRGELLVPIEAALPDRRSNDAGVHASGSIVVGTVGEGKPGRLYAAAGSAVVEVEIDVECPNGPIWTDPCTMLLVDTLGRAIEEWTTDPRNGRPIRRVRRRDLSGFPGLPDGLCLDEDGSILIASWGGGVVGRIDCDDTITLTDLPIERVTCPRWAGPDRDVLVVTTADGQGSGSGGLWAWRPGGRSARAMLATAG